MNIPQIPKFYDDVYRIILIPSQTLFNYYKNDLKNEKISLKNAPKLLDCFQPLYFIKDNQISIIISPFLGHIGINHLLSFFKNKSIKELLFIGSSAFYGTQNEFSNLPLKPFTPQKFYILTSLEDTKLEVKEIIVKNILNLDSRINISCLSSCFNYYENLDLINKISETNSVNIFDMEVAYIADTCTKLGINFGSYLIITDHYVKGSIHNSLPKQITKTIGFKEAITDLNSHIFNPKSL
jgi:hypothetical protein